MKDIYDATMSCDKCKKSTIKSYKMKDGFKIRIWSCPQCGETWEHPTDMDAYKEFIDIKKRDFEVKLRPVGNSWTVSIPKEIIKFEEVSQTKVIRMSLNEPGKLTLFFRREKRVYP